ncbi:hypothetical protein [Sporosarcina sp. FA9]|uniref:hypothetical protein n=1 Tax=Sporosarcina sp. FA9 TaxID=3413030 RepID=UPI003F655FB5
MSIHIKVGVIGPLWIREALQRCFDRFPSMIPIFRLSDNLIDADVFTQELSTQVDCLLYSGRVPYMIARKSIPAPMPTFYIPLKGTGLYRALYLLRRKKEWDHISFDGIKTPFIDSVRLSLNEVFSYTFLDETVSSSPVIEIVNYHKKIVKDVKNCVVVTSLKSVHEKLKEEGIVSEWLIPTEEDMIVILERLLLSTTQRKQKEMQIVFGRVYIDDTAYMKEFATEKQLQNRNHQIYKILFEFVEQFEGYLTTLSDYEYLFVTNRGAFERITEGYKSLPILDEAKKSLNINLSIGIGFGESAFQAGGNARAAVFQAKSYGGRCGFIVREDREVFGPIDLIAPIKYPLSVTDQNLIEKAKSIGTNAAYLEKTLSMVKRKNNNKFSAHEMAEILGVTTRSSHRIIQTWLDAKIIEVVGVEKLTTRGRPRQIFSIKE